MRLSVHRSVGNLQLWHNQRGNRARHIFLHFALFSLRGGVPKWHTYSVTRFGAISLLWRFFKVFGKKLRWYLVLGKMLSYFGNLLTPIGLISIILNGQILNKPFLHLVTLHYTYLPAHIHPDMFKKMFGQAHQHAKLKLFGFPDSSALRSMQF